jgi:hypothetical protein
MKGSAVRIRASALKKALHTRTFVIEALHGGRGQRTGQQERQRRVAGGGEGLLVGIDEMFGLSELTHLDPHGSGLVWMGPIGQWNKLDIMGRRLQSRLLKQDSEFIELPELLLRGQSENAGLDTSRILYRLKSGGYAGFVLRNPVQLWSHDGVGVKGPSP